MTTVFFGFCGFAGDEVTSFYCFGVMNCIQYANRTRENFPVVENSAGSCFLKMQQMNGVADFLRALTLSLKQ